MQAQTQSEMSIRTFKVLLDAERKVWRALLLHQEKSLAKRYMLEFPAEQAKTGRIRHGPCQATNPGDRPWPNQTD